MGIMPDKQLEERDANPTADTPGCFRGRRAPTALTAGGTESSEVVARLCGTESSNPLPSSDESPANLSFSGKHPTDDRLPRQLKWSTRRAPACRCFEARPVCDASSLRTRADAVRSIRRGLADLLAVIMLGRSF